MRFDSELFFEKYLNSLGYYEGKHFEYEEDIGRSTRPDYRLRAVTPPIIFEVKSYSNESKQSRVLVKRAEENSQRIVRGLHFAPAIHLNPYKKTRAKFDKARLQFRPYRDDHACVLVLDKASGFLIDFSPAIFAGAVFGDVQLVISRATGESRWRFGGNGVLQPKMNTTFSAVCGLEKIKPDHKKLMNIFKREHGSISEKLLECADFQTFADLYKEIAKRHKLNPDKEIIKATVILNPHARIPINTSLFSGTHDEVWRFDDSGKFISHQNNT